MRTEWVNYTKYLRDIVESREMNGEFNELLQQLNDIEFTWSIDFDENRALDGYDLRRDYCDEFEVDLVGSVTVLEVLVALARRIDNEYIGDPGEEHPEIIFWEMIGNLTLIWNKDNHYDSGLTNYTIKKWLNREFNQDGLGSPFPLEKTLRDQRKIEIWAQMLEYITENYE